MTQVSGYKSLRVIAEVEPLEIETKVDAEDTTELVVISCEKISQALYAVGEIAVSVD